MLSSLSAAAGPLPSPLAAFSSGAVDTVGVWITAVHCLAAAQGSNLLLQSS